MTTIKKIYEVIDFYTGERKGGTITIWHNTDDNVFSADKLDWWDWNQMAEVLRDDDLLGKHESLGKLIR